MDQELKKLKKLVKFMQKEGVISLKQPNIELQLSPGALFPQESQVKPPSPPEDAHTDETFSPEDVMMWSAPGYVEDSPH